MAEQSVYSAPEAELATVDAGEYPGLDRLQYFLYSMGIGIANMVLTMMLMDSPLSMVVMLAAIGASVWIIVQRLHNVGMNGWWTLAFIVPLLNIYVGLVCLAFPPGYKTHRTFDTAAKVLIGLFIAFMLLGVIGIIAAIALPAMSG